MAAPMLRSSMFGVAALSVSTSLVIRIRTYFLPQVPGGMEVQLKVLLWLPAILAMVVVWYSEASNTPLPFQSTQV